jgi:hypothetical protein
MIIYALTDPDSGEIRYIGKTGQSPKYRLTQHLKRARDGKPGHLCCWLRMLLREDQRPGICVLEELAADADWQVSERAWIERGRVAGWPLTNMTAGGEGLLDPSPELRQQRAERMRGNHIADGNRNAAGARSEAFRHRMAESARVTKNHSGHALSAETRKVISEKLMGHETVKGEDNGQARLTVERVREIRMRYAAGGISHRTLAQEYGVRHETIRKVVNRETWQHVM